MNYYAYIPLGTFIVNVFTWTFIYAQQRHTAVNSAYLTFAAFVAVWNLDLFILWSPLPDSVVMPWEKITTTTGFLVVFLFFHFVYIFLDKEKDMLYCVLTVLFLIATGTNIFTDSYLQGYVKYPWGTSLVPGTLFVPMVCAVYIIPVLLSSCSDNAGRCDANSRPQSLTVVLSSSELFWILKVIFPRIQSGSSNLPRLFAPSLCLPECNTSA